MAQTPILRRHNKRQANTVTRRLAAALLCMWVQGAEAAKPTLTARLDTAQITLGDPLHLRLIVDRDAGQRTLFPDLDEQLAPFVVRSNDEGNSLYRAADFAGARQRYFAAVETGIRDVRLFYNLGNACFKSEHLGESVLWYERALQLDPRDEDVLANLRFVARVKRDQDPEQVGAGIYAVYLWPTLNELFVMTSLGLLGLFLVACWRLWWRPGMYVQVTLIVLSICVLGSGQFTGARLQRQLTRTEAVVVTEGGTARSGPEVGQTPVFVVHEGTKVVVERREAGCSCVWPTAWVVGCPQKSSQSFSCVTGTWLSCRRGIRIIEHVSHPHSRPQSLKLSGHP